MWYYSSTQWEWSQKIIRPPESPHPGPAGARVTPLCLGLREDGRRSVGFIYLFIFPPGYVAFWGSKACHRLTGESVSWCLETSLFKTPFLGWSSLPTYLFCLSFCFLYFILPVFEDNGLLFWLPDVLCQPRSCFAEFARRWNVLLRNLWGRTWSSRPIPPPSFPLTGIGLLKCHCLHL